VSGIRQVAASCNAHNFSVANVDNTTGAMMARFALLSFVDY